MSESGGLSHVEDEERDYFLEFILPNMRPMTDEEYMHGPAVIMHTLARYSYILYGKDVYWCSEWDPGLIVVCFSPDANIGWCALRSPNPNFGGRSATRHDLENYDDEAENYQYNLVFNAWDAQFDEKVREWRSFKLYDEETVTVHEAAMEHVNKLGEEMKARYGMSLESKSEWMEQCKKNLKDWAGEGIRTR